MAIYDVYGFQLTNVGKPIELRELPALEPAEDEVVLEVAGCGVCHTDVGFAYDGVPTRHALPLVLGHEISGRVVASGNGENWVGRSVIVPAVIACGKCEACLAGRPTICRRQFMPGNDGDGGFATHVRVPKRGLCAVPDKLPAGITLEMLSVVADAVTTPFEALRRANAGPGDVVVIVGAGGIGGFGVQIASSRGASVAAIDVDENRLALAAEHGASLTLNPATVEEKTIRSAVREFFRKNASKGTALKIFEMSGTPAGQLTAFSLLDFGAYLAVVGFTPKKVEVRLSNLMAFDATACGNWGCPPEQYPAALEMVLAGKIAIAPFIEFHPLEEAAAVLEGVARHAFRRRVVLTTRHHQEAA